MPEDWTTGSESTRLNEKKNKDTKITYSKKSFIYYSITSIKTPINKSRNIKTTPIKFKFKILNCIMLV